MIYWGLKILNACIQNENESTDVIVKHGKPILVVSYATVLKIVFGTIALTLLTIFYCIDIFIVAVHTKLHVGVYINMISQHKDGDILPTLFAMPALISLILNLGADLIIYGCFKSVKSIMINRFLFVYVLLCLGNVFLIMMFSTSILEHIYGNHTSLHDGITDAMLNYSTNSKAKSDIDIMQVQFQCCGSKSYDEWYSIQWYDDNLVKKGFSDNCQTPFSCCSMKSPFPCIHHRIESTGNIYLYRPETNLSISREGCTIMIQKRKQEVGLKIVGRLSFLMALMIFLTIGLRFIQTAHFENFHLKDTEKAYTIWLIGCYQGKKNTNEPPPVPPIPLELMD